MTDNLNRKLAAIMFADIVSYSRLMGSDESEALKLLKYFETISKEIVEEYDGIIIKKNGDQIFCEFTSTKNAVDASIQLQEILNKYNDSRPKDFKLEVRIGIHIGDVVKREDTATLNSNIDLIFPLGISVKIDEVFDTTATGTIYKKDNPFETIQIGDKLTFE